MRTITLTDKEYSTLQDALSAAIVLLEKSEKDCRRFMELKENIADEERSVADKHADILHAGREAVVNLRRKIIEAVT